MFVNVHTPDHLNGPELDAYLEQGWFRMGQTIFTTNFAHVKDQVLSTIWLRVHLPEYERDSVHAKLLQRNARFAIRLAPAALTTEQEALFARYRERLSFTVSESLQHLLFGKEEANSVYDTYEVTVRDQGRLIACGFFDLGEESAEGIVSFYDPEYKKFSLGKYLIYSKIQFCQELGLRYFYPGYFVPGNPSFDYKLTIARDALQFLQLGSNTWKSLSVFSEADIPVQTMHTRLNALRLVLERAGIVCSVVKYEFFDAGLIPEMRHTGLLDFPLFLHFGHATDEPIPILVVFDVRHQQFRVFMCTPVWRPDRTNPDTSFYSAFFLKPVQEVYQSCDPQDMAEWLLRINGHVALQQLGGSGL